MKQTNMFSASNADLPLFSGTSPRGQESTFSPAPSARQIPLALVQQPISDMVEAMQVAADLLGDYLGSDPANRDLDDVAQALEMLEATLSKRLPPEALEILRAALSKI